MKNETAPEFTATVKMPTRETAVKLGTLWSRKTLVGHAIGPKQDDGSATVTLYRVKNEDKAWIQETAERLAARSDPA